MAHMRQGGTRDSLPRPIVGRRRAVSHSPSRGLRLVLDRLAASGGAARPKIQHFHEAAQIEIDKAVDLYKFSKQFIVVFL